MTDLALATCSLSLSFTLIYAEEKRLPCAIWAISDAGFQIRTRRIRISVSRYAIGMQPARVRVCRQISAGIEGSARQCTAEPSQVALAGTSRDTHCQRGFRQPRKIGLAISIVRYRLGRRRMNGGRGPIGPLGKFARTDKRGCRICLVAFAPLVKSRQGCTMTQSLKADRAQSAVAG